MLKKLFGRRDGAEEDGTKPIKANLGEENKFYYNKELKSWVVKGEEHLIENKMKSPPPPPKRPTTTEIMTERKKDIDAIYNNKAVNTKKNLYVQTPGLNIAKKTSSANLYNVIPNSGLHASYIPNEKGNNTGVNQYGLIQIKNTDINNLSEENPVSNDFRFNQNTELAKHNTEINGHEQDTLNIQGSLSHKSPNMKCIDKRQDDLNNKHYFQGSHILNEEQSRLMKTYPDIDANKPKNITGYMANTNKTSDKLSSSILLPIGNPSSNIQTPIQTFSNIPPSVNQNMNSSPMIIPSSPNKSTSLNGQLTPNILIRNSPSTSQNFKLNTINDLPAKYINSPTNQLSTHSSINPPTYSSICSLTSHTISSNVINVPTYTGYNYIENGHAPNIISRLGKLENTLTESSINTSFMQSSMENNNFSDGQQNIRKDIKFQQLKSPKDEDSIKNINVDIGSQMESPAENSIKQNDLEDIDKEKVVQEDQVLESIQKVSSELVHNKFDSTISNSESDMEFLSCARVLRQRQRVADNFFTINGDVNDEVGSNHKEDAEFKINSVDHDILDLLSIFGLRITEEYEVIDMETNKIRDDHIQELNESLDNSDSNINLNNTSTSYGDSITLEELCKNIKHEKLEQISYFLNLIYNNIQEKFIQYDSATDTISGIGNLTNEVFSDISIRMNTILTNCDIIEREYVNTRKMYEALSKKYNNIYKQYETDILDLRRELETEKSLHITITQEYEEALQKLQNEFVVRETSSNELLQQYYSHIQHLHQQLEILQKELLEGRSLFDQKSNETELLKTELNNKNDELDKIYRELEHSRQELANANDNFNNSNQEMSQLKLDVENLSGEIEKLNKQLIYCEDEKKELLSESKDLQEVLKKQIEVLSNELQESNNLRESLENSIKFLKEESAGINMELNNKYQGQIAFMEKYNEELEQQTVLLQEDIDHLRNKLLSSESSFKKIQDDKADLQSRSDQMTDYINQLQESVTSLRSQIDTLSGQLTNSIEEKNKTLALYESTKHFLADVEKENDEYKNKFHELTIENEARNNTINQLEHKLNEVMGEKCNLETNMKQILERETLNEQINKQLEEYRESKKSLQNNNKILFEQNKQLKEDYQILTNEHRHLIQLKDDHIREVSELNNQIEREKESRETLEDELVKNKQHTEWLQSELHRLDTEWRDRQSILETNYETLYTQLIETNYKLKSKEEELQQSIQELDRIMKEKQVDNDFCKEDMSLLRSENNKIKEVNEALYTKLEAFSKDIDFLNNQLEWIRRYSPQVYESMIQYTDIKQDNKIFNDSP
ncbi:uncharacterized protein CMU_025450 [Cryptosporidium muris RN66]|uniref:Uncharacterized protein n=1 Tax=Cryptosporidium muris (strain RN66) TaxID=441375 RepID=B6AAY7_CRYMR|nr:uncharacterized protein CMU_025450 [Cryptosporidium muris RN66]EEA05539.1 hypothetical protein, conserved [Cryptosporidium muris RN66]|eukprot:XP_002139888.1 hypothetical protein [Cryptosporidium muris RN66]